MYIHVHVSKIRGPMGSKRHTAMTHLHALVLFCNLKYILFHFFTFYCVEARKIQNYKNTRWARA